MFRLGIDQGGVREVSFTATSVDGSMYYSLPLQSLNPSSVFPCPINFTAFSVSTACISHDTSYDLMIGKIQKWLSQVQVNYILTPTAISSAITVKIHYLVVGK